MLLVIKKKFLFKYVKDEDHDQCLSSGMDDYISKPVYPNVVKELVEQCLLSRDGFNNGSKKIVGGW